MMDEKIKVLLADKLKKDNALSDDEISDVAGGAGSLNETKYVKVNLMTSTQGWSDVMADPSLGVNAGDTVFVEALNKSYKIEYVMRLNYNLGLMIMEPGTSSSDKYFMSNVRKE